MCPARHTGSGRLGSPEHLTYPSRRRFDRHRPCRRVSRSTHLPAPAHCCFTSNINLAACPPTGTSRLVFVGDDSGNWCALGPEEWGCDSRQDDASRPRNPWTRAVRDTRALQLLAGRAQTVARDRNQSNGSLPQCSLTPAVISVAEISKTITRRSPEVSILGCSCGISASR
jgi:hypothetical protein